MHTVLKFSFLKWIRSWTKICNVNIIFYCVVLFPLSMLSMYVRFKIRSVFISCVMLPVDRIAWLLQHNFTSWSHYSVSFTLADGETCMIRIFTISKRSSPSQKDCVYSVWENCSFRRREYGILWMTETRWWCFKLLQV